MRRATLILFSFLSYAGLFAQSNSFVFTNYTTANGLSDNSVTSILQDSRGFMWFATREGLSRFDGTNFKVFFAQKNNKTSLPGNTILYLNETKPGHLIFLANGSLTSMNTISQEFSQPPVGRDKNYSSIAQAKNKSFFLGLTDTCFIINSDIEMIDTLVPPLKNKGYNVIASIFDDGWTSTVQEDWVQVTKGNIRVLIHYPNKNADAYNTVLKDGTNNAWNILVAPHYSSISNFANRDIQSWESVSFAEADLIENSTRKNVHVVFLENIIQEVAAVTSKLLHPTNRLSKKSLALIINPHQVGKVWRNWPITTSLPWPPATSKANGRITFRDLPNM